MHMCQIACLCVISSQESVLLCGMSMSPSRVCLCVCVSQGLCNSVLLISEHVMSEFIFIFIMCGCVWVCVWTCAHVHTHIFLNERCSLALKPPAFQSRLVPPPWPIPSAVAWGHSSWHWGCVNTLYVECLENTSHSSSFVQGAD